MAQKHGMVHVGDAEPYLEFAATYGQNVQLSHSLVALGQPRVMRQQYLDFAAGRNFRKSMVVHQHREEQIAPVPDPDRLADLHWAGCFTKFNDEKATEGMTAYRNQRGAPLYTREPAVVALIEALTKAWPSSMSFDALLSEIPVDAQDDAQACNSQTHNAQTRKTLLAALQTLFRLNRLRYTLEPVYQQVASSHPKLIPGAAYLINKKNDPDFGISVFSLWHENAALTLQDVEAFILPYIDGSHSRKQLATTLREALHNGDVPDTNGKSIKGQRNLDAKAAKIVTQVLELLHKQGLLYTQGLMAKAG